MNKYLFLSDVDGTLLRVGIGIAPGVKEAVKKFRDMGGLFTLCTGRSQFSTGWIVKELDIDIPCVLYNGAAIYDFGENKFLYASPMSNDVLETVREVYDSFPGVSIQVYTKDRIYQVRHNELLKARGIKEELGDSLTEINNIHGEILKIVLASEDIPMLKRCGEVFKSNALNFAFSSRRFAEVISAEAGKEKGLFRMAEYFNVKTEHTFAAGDGMTDLPMLKASGFSFAPESSAKAVLDICDMIIPPCEDGGMEKALLTAIDIIMKH
ncbi:MAG: Cof-type HAD-IIB family hydrolase [Acetivibrionales bacterium]|jgi:Cof subfamily protein (haloacid dehalogenase superfamily)